MRLIDNVWVNGVCYPKGCLPPEPIADLIGDHAWEDGSPTVAASTPDVDAQTPAATDALSPAASVADPATLDGSLMGQLDEEPGDPDDTPEPAGPTEDAPPVADQVDPATPDAATPPPTALPDPLPVEPPRAGRGASRTAWADYAAALHLNATEDMKLADIIAMVDAHLAQFTASEQE